MGGLHKHAGSYGFNGSARLSHGAGGLARPDSPMGAAEPMPPLQSVLRPRRLIDTLRHLFAARPNAARLLFSQRRLVCQMRHARTTPDKPQPGRVSSGFILAAFALYLAIATGCSNIQSQ